MNVVHCCATSNQLTWGCETGMALYGWTHWTKSDATSSDKSLASKVRNYQSRFLQESIAVWFKSDLNCEHNARGTSLFILLCITTRWRGNGALQKLHASKEVLLLPCNLPSLVISEIVRWTWSLPLLPAASFLPRQHPTMSGFAVPGGRIKQHASESPPKKWDIEKDSESQSYRKKLEKGKWSSQSSRSNIGSS